MDWQIRLCLIVVGLILVGYIYFDYYKKKQKQKENERLMRQFSGLDEQTDSSGFDRSGVGSARLANASGSSINDFIEEQANQSIKNNTYINKRDEPVIEDSEELSNKNFDTAIEDSIGNNLESLNQLTSQPNKLQTPQGLEETLIAAQEQTQNKDQVVIQDEPSAKEINKNAVSSQEQCVFSLIIQAPQNKTFSGKDFLPLFLSQGLRHGDMGIFHRHQKKKSGSKSGSKGVVLFSLANAIAPGTFSLINLESFETPALALFMTLPGPDDAQVAYSAMLNTARLLQSELGGDLLDETKSQYTEQIHNHRLDQIQEFNRKGFML